MVPPERRSLQANLKRILQRSKALNEIFGLVLMGVLVSLGAPFWIDHATRPVTADYDVLGHLSSFEEF